MSEIFYVCDENPHEIGNEECPECWHGYPKSHSCGGLTHAEFYDENYDDVVLVFRCDKCDSTDSEE